MKEFQPCRRLSFSVWSSTSEGMTIRSSDRSLILGNRATNLDGHSIDLTARNNRFLGQLSCLPNNRLSWAANSSTRVQDYQIGDISTLLEIPISIDEIRLIVALIPRNVSAQSSSFWAISQVPIDGTVDPGA